MVSCQAVLEGMGIPPLAAERSQAFLALDSPGEIEIEFDERPVADGATELSVTFAPDGAGTRLLFAHSGFPGSPGWNELYEGIGAGWPHALADLTVLFETGVPVENGFRHA